MATNPYKVVPNDAFLTMLMDAGVVLSEFDFANPYDTPDDDVIIAVTSGGLNPTCVPRYSDLGEDVDNVPNNTKEFLHLDGWDCSLGYTSLRFNKNNTLWALGAADEGTAPTGAPSGTIKIVPRAEVRQSDFKDIYAAVPMVDGGIYVVCLKNAISTGGLSIQSTKNGKATSSVALTGYISIEDVDEIPMEYYIIPGARMKVTSVAGTTVGKTAITVDRATGTGESYVYKITDSAVPVDVGDSTSSGWTAWNGEDEITAATGKIITVAIAKSNKVVAYGSATVTAKAST